MKDFVPSGEPVGSQWNLFQTNALHRDGKSNDGVNCSENPRKPVKNGLFKGLQWDHWKEFLLSRNWPTIVNLNCPEALKVITTPPALPEALILLLKEVSRSFYLTLRVLPRAIRPQISLAYLLARATDTIADTEIVPIAQRLEALQFLRDRILAKSGRPLNFALLAQHQSSRGERELLERCNEAIALLGSLSVADQASIREVLEMITSGQELDIKRFSTANANQIFALATDQELDDYTYRVA